MKKISSIKKISILLIVCLLVVGTNSTCLATEKEVEGYFDGVHCTLKGEVAYGGIRFYATTNQKIDCIMIEGTTMFPYTSFDEVSFNTRACSIIKILNPLINFAADAHATFVINGREYDLYTKIFR